MNDFRTPASEKIGTELQEAKAHLQQAGETFKNALNGQINEIGSEAKRYAKIAGITAAVVVTGYLVYALSKGKRYKKSLPETEGRRDILIETRAENPIVTSIKTAIASFLLTIAKEKIITFIEKMTEKHEKPTAPGAGKTERART